MSEPGVPGELILVSDGDSSQATYSPDGKTLLFVSAKRPNHTGAQIYEKDLASGEERRFTFQSGNTFGPQYAPKGGWITYASTTDEAKEYPQFSQPDNSASKLPLAYQEQTEIYLHALESREISRITKRMGYDGEAHFGRDGRTLVWTRAQPGHLEVVFLTHGSAAPATKLARLGKNVSQYVSSPDGRYSAWIDWGDDLSSNSLKLQNGKEVKDVALNGAFRLNDLYFTPDNKWLFWSQQSVVSAGFVLWSLELETGCVRPLKVPDASERRHPVISPDMKWLTYTVFRDGRSRIAQAAFEPQSGPCTATP